MIDEPDLAARVAALSLEQKVRLLTGADFWSLHAEPAAGLRRLVVSDGPAGVRGERWDERDTSANVPSPTALAATWDEELVEQVGRLLASEARRKGVDVLLAPTVNLHRTPYGGRHFECFSEDPLLTARIGVAYVRGVQGGGVGATVKHFVANDSETERMTLDARVDERTLRELYLAPFEAIVREAGVWAVMAAYNGVNGEPMTESALLRDVLQREWGFDGSSCRTGSRPARRSRPPRGARPRHAGPGRAVGRRAARRGARRAGRRGGDRREGRAHPAPRGARRGARGLAGRRGARVTTTRRSPRCCAAPPRPDSCWRTTTVARCRSTVRARRVAVIGPNAAAARTLGRRQRDGLSALHRVAARGAASRPARGRPRRPRRRRARDRPDTGRRAAMGAHARRRRLPASRCGSSTPRRRSSRPSSGPAAPSPGWAPSATASRRARSPASRSTPCCGRRMRARTRSRAPASAATRWPSAATWSSTASSSWRRARTSSKGMMLPPQAVHEVRLDPGEEVEIVLDARGRIGEARRRIPRGNVSAQPAATARHRRRGDRARGGARARRRRRRRRRRDDRGGRKRGLRSRVARAARPPGRARRAHRRRKSRRPSSSSTRGRPSCLGRSRAIARVVPGQEFGNASARHARSPEEAETGSAGVRRGPGLRTTWGSRRGREVVQLYARRRDGCVERPDTGGSPASPRSRQIPASR